MIGLLMTWCSHGALVPVVARRKALRSRTPSSTCSPRQSKLIAIPAVQWWTERSRSGRINDYMDRERDDTRGGSRTRSRSLDATVVIALASVLVAVIYNGLQVRNTARQLDQSQSNLELSTRANTVSTFMEMHDRIVHAHIEMNKSILAYAADSSEANTVRVIDAITPLEGIVYALDHHYVPRGAAGLWRSYLVCDYETVRRGLRQNADSDAESGLALYVPTLARFARSHPVPIQECVFNLST
jgi:hypothetical protein